MSTSMPPANGWSPRPGYRRSAYRTGAAYPVTAASAPLPFEWTPQVSSERRRGRIATIVLTVVGGLGLLAMLVVIYFSAAQSSGFTGMMGWMALALALVPLCMVVAAVWWIDRWSRSLRGS